jgi:hypothetical protein
MNMVPVDWSPVAAYFVVVAVMIDKNRSLTCGKPHTLTAHFTVDVKSFIHQWTEHRNGEKRMNCD